jgi:hypothetical protein
VLMLLALYRTCLISLMSLIWILGASLLMILTIPVDCSSGPFDGPPQLPSDVSQSLAAIG